jgi:hypothetical protein
MDVRSRSVLVLTLLLVPAMGHAVTFHDSLQAGVVCSSEGHPVKFEIFEAPAADDGFFKVSDGLCRALPLDEDDGSTLFPVALCLNNREQEFTMFFGGWLNMLTVKFKDESDENSDLLCR